MYLLESAKIHWVKNVLCVIRMLLQRDGLLEGFRLQSYEDKRASVRADESLRDTHNPPHPLPNVNMRPLCYQKAASNQGEEEPVEEEIMTGTC